MNSNYLSTEQMKRIQESAMVRCASEAHAREYMQKDPDLVQIRFMENGKLIHAVVMGAAFNRATGRTA